MSEDPLPEATVQLAREARGEAIAPSSGDLRDLLPGLEPERRVDDWGRSERVERAVDRALYGFLYHYWFRVEVEGVEHVPATGGALLVANRSGALPADAAMIAKAIGQEHPRPRPVCYLTDSGVHALPGLGMLATKLGVLAEHPANLHRLLFDERSLVLVFPEGRRSAGKPLSRRYRLASFEGLDFVGAADRAGVPIVPVAVLGAEEAVPALVPLRLPWPLRLPLAARLPLPAKLRIRFLEPVSVEEAGGADLAGEIRALIEDNLLELLAARRSVWLG